MIKLPCRLCGAQLVHTFADLGASPLSNSYLSDESVLGMEPTYPLKVYVCSACKLVQLPEWERAETIFGGEYLYFSSYSESWLRHSEAYVNKMTERFGLGEKSFVVEIASNDGYLLQYFVKKNIPVLGVEPAKNVAQIAIKERNVPTLNAFFGVETATDLAKKGPLADLIAGNNVFAHVPNLHDFVGGMKLLLAPGGVITLEFPHLQRLVDSNQFDTIYHEHFSYLSLFTARRVLADHGLRVFDVEELSTHGGSLRLFACHDDDNEKPTTARVGDLEARERTLGYESLDLYLSFQPRIEAIKRDLLAFLIEQKRAGKRVVAYGAAAKGNTLLNYCGVRTDLLDFVVDRSPHKQGRYLPGVRIPIRAPEAIDALRPDYVLILPWNLRDEITAQMAHIRGWGGQFVVPIPALEVLA